MAGFMQTELYQLLTEPHPTHDTWDQTLRLIQSDPATAKQANAASGDTYLHVLAREVGRSGWAGTYTEPLVYALSNAGVDVNAVNKQGDTALHTLLQEKSAQFMLARALLRVGVDPAARNSEGCNLRDLLHKSAALYEFNKGYLYRVHTKKGIWRAVEAGDDVTVETLLRSWVRAKVNRQGQSLRSLAVMAGHQRIMDLIDKYSATNELVHAALARDTEKMKKIFRVYSEEVDINTTDLSSHEEGCLYPSRCLLSAVLGQSPAATRLLVEHGADVNLQLREGPVYLFKGPASEATYKTLMPKADLSLKNPDGNNLMYLLCWNEHKQVSDQFVFKLLHKNGLDLLTSRNKDGETARDFLLTQYDSNAANSHKYQCYRKRHRDYLKMMDRVVVSMVRHNEWDQVEKLICRGYGYHLLEMTDGDGQSLVSIARQAAAHDVLELLQSVPVFRKQLKEVIDAIKDGDEKKVELYLITVSHELPRDLGGRSLLHLAVLHGNFTISKILVDCCRPGVDLKDNLLRTPYHYACATGRSDLQHLLADSGSDPSARDVFGLSPEDYKEENRHKYPQVNLDNFARTELDRVYGQCGLCANFYIRLREAIDKEDVDMANDVLCDMDIEGFLLDDLRALERCGVIKGVEYEPIQFLAARRLQSGGPGSTEILRLLVEHGVDVNEQWTYGECEQECQMEDTCTHYPRSLTMVGGWQVEQLLADEGISR